MLLELFEPANYSFDWKAVPHLAAAAIAAVVCVFVIVREQGTRVSDMFAAATALFVFWMVGRGLLRCVTHPELVVWLSRYFYVLIMLAMALLYQFIALLLRRDRERRAFIRFNWVLGALLAIVSLATPWVIDGTSTYSWGLEPQHGALGGVIVIWTVALIVAATLDLIVVSRRVSRGTVEHQRIRWFAAAVVCLYSAAVDFLPASGVPVYPLAFVPVLGFILITAYVTLRFGLVEVTPQLAANELAEMVRGAVLLLDRDGVIQVVNQRATEVLRRERAALVGQPVRAVLGEVAGAERLAVLARSEDRNAEKEFIYSEGGEPRDLALSVSIVHDRQGREVAYVCLLRDVTEQKLAQQERIAEGLTDAVTGLPNRTLFLDRLDETVRRAREAGGRNYAVCFVGLDRMRVINEDLGYGVGDRVLLEVGERLRRLVTHGEMVARLGGDEFGVLIEAPPHSGYVKTFVERLELSLRAPLTLDEHQLYLSTSVGVAGSDLDPEGGADLLRKAGVAMYRVKERGGGGVHTVAPGEASTHRTKLEADLRRAVEAAEFRVYYQPVIDLEKRRVAGFEALVRWQHPERGLLLPGEFIEFAEQIGLVTAIDCWVLSQACTDLKRLQAAGGDPALKMNVNMAEECLRRPDIVERVQEQLQRNSLNPATLQLEVLERIALVAAARDNLQRLRAVGLGLCIDDFGTGYSALSRLHTLPITVLKVDRDFVRAMTLGEGGEKIIRSIVALGENLGLNIVAEGAGMSHEVQRLYDLGCRQVQGFYFSAAIAFDRAAELVRDPRPFREQFERLELRAAATEPPLRTAV